MSNNKLNSPSLRIFAFFLSLLMLIPTFFTIADLAIPEAESSDTVESASVSSMEAASGSGLGTVYLQPYNARLMQTFFAGNSSVKYIESAYAVNGYVSFRLYYTPPAGKSTFDEDVTVYYRTRDVTAVSEGYTDADNNTKSKDYAETDSSYTIKAGSAAGYTTITVATNKAPYALCIATHSSTNYAKISDMSTLYDFNSYGTDFSASGYAQETGTLGTGTYYTVNNGSATGKTKSYFDANSTAIPYKSVTGFENVGYASRYFQMEIYKVDGNAAVGSKKTAYGTVPADQYIPVEYMDGGWQLSYYGKMSKQSIPNIYHVDDYRPRSYYKLKDTEFGKKVSAQVIQTGFGHYYFSADMRYKSEDLYQNDMIVGLYYDCMGDMKNKTMNGDVWNYGFVTARLDGPFKNSYGNCYRMDFSSYNNKEFHTVKYGTWNKKHHYSDKYDYMDFDYYEYDYVYYDNVEWNSSTYQYEKVKTTFNSYLKEYTYSYVKNRSKYSKRTEKSTYFYGGAYLVEGDPELIGVMAYRDSKGDNRSVLDIHLYIMQRDDSPITIKQMFLEDPDDLGLTVSDTWYLAVRFNEPVQVGTSSTPTMRVKIEGTTYTFNYAYGSGTDTLVFGLPLKNLSTTAKITDVEVVSAGNGDKLYDFSSVDPIQFTRYNDAQNDYFETYVTKQRGTRWTFAISYPKGTDGYYPFLDSTHKSITFSFKKTTGCWLDPRKPAVSKITCNTSSEIKTSHTVYVTLDYSNTNATVYYEWTQNYDSGIPSTIPKPSAYTHKATDSSGTGSMFQITGSEKGTVFLWIKTTNPFGSTDERLCGPFYFDNSSDSIKNISFVTQSGGVWTDAYSSSVSVQPSKSKTIEFTVDHTSDYRSASVKSASTKRVYDKLDLIWTTDSSWGSDGVKTTNLLLDSDGGARTITVVDAKTKTVTKDKLVFSTSTDQTSVSTGVASSTFKSYSSGVAQQETFVTEYTYRVTLTCDDFDIDEDSYGKYYLGILMSDAMQNTHSVGDTTLVAGKDYITSYISYFDRRDILASDAEFTGGNDILSSYTGVNTAGAQTTLSAASGLRVYDGLQTSKFVIDISEAGGISKALLENGSSELRLVMKKPNADAENFTVPSGATYTASTSKYTSALLNNPAGGSQDTPWFTWKLLQESPARSGSDVYYDRIEVTMKTYTDIGDEIFGYYDIYAKLITDKGTAMEATKVTEVFDFYLGAPDNNKQKVVNETANIVELNKGKLFVNDVFRLNAAVQYSYMDTNQAVVSEFYVKNGSLTFSSVEAARLYLTYMEYQDFTLFRIPNAETATSMKEGHGTKLIAEGEEVEPKAGQWWICYKRRTWTPGSVSTTQWVYYYYGVTGDGIDISSLRGNLTAAVNSVVSSILKQGSNIVLTSKEGTDDRGIPSIDEKWIRFAPESVTFTKSGTKFANALTYTGDPGIYDSEVSVVLNGKSYTAKTISAQTLSFSDYGNFYMALLGEGTAAPVYGSVPKSSKTAIIKDLADTVYAKTIGKEAGSVIAPSGLYQCIEIDENGFSVQYYYVDKTAPQLNFEYEVWKTDGNGNQTTSKANQYYTTQDGADHSISGVSFMMTGLGKQGAKDSAGALAEPDKYAYVAIFDSAKVQLIDAMTVDDFTRQGRYILDEGDYVLEICDRSGNSYVMPIRLVSTKMTVDLVTDDYVFIKINNRSEVDIKEFEITLDGQSIDTEFAYTKTYNESGSYRIHIADWYGITYDKEFTYQREVPQINWVYEEGATFPTITSETECSIIRKDTSTSYTVVSSVLVGFSFLTTSDIKVEFLNDSATEEDFFIDTSIGRYTTYTQQEMKNFQVKFSFKAYPNVYVIYSVYYDLTAPQIGVTYQHNSYDYGESSDLLLQLKRKIRDGIYFEVGDIITPSRIDYKLLSTDYYTAYSGSTTSTKSAVVAASDESGIRKMVIYLNDETIYSGPYYSNGVYPDGVNHNLLSDYGEYRILVWDVLSNCSEFFLTNDDKSRVTYNVDGTEQKPTADAVYKTDSSGQLILDADGNPIVDSYWYYAQKFVVTGTEEDDLYVSTDVLLNKNSLESYIRNSTTYNYVQYGNTSAAISVNGDAIVQYLLTDEMGRQYFLGLKYIDGALYRFRYEIIAQPDSTDGFDVVDVVEEEPVIDQNAIVRSELTVYEFEGLLVTLTATKDSSGILTLTVTDYNTSSAVVTVETRIDCQDSDAEPAYFKTMLSKRQSDADFKNDKGDLSIGSSGSGEIFYTNGTFVKAKTEGMDPYVSEIRISYNATGLDFETFYTVFSLNDIPKEEQYSYTDGDGYYCFEVINLFGNKKIYYFAVSNSLLVNINAIFEDGADWTYSEQDNALVCSNDEITFLFTSNNTTYTVLKNGEPFLPNVTRSTSAILLALTEEGEYVVTIRDKNGNEVVKQASIKFETSPSMQGLIYGFNERALKKNEGYTNKKLSLSAKTIAASGIYYIEIRSDYSTTVVFDALSAQDYGIFPAEDILDCIGLLGDGTYTVFVRNRYGSTAEETVHYRETPTLSLSRMTKAEQAEMPYSIEDALERGFLSNSSLFFQTVSDTYIFTVNGVECTCYSTPKVLNFTTNVYKGEIAYEVYYRDEYGFEYFFTAKLFRTVLSITPDESVSIRSDNGTNLTSDDIVMIWSDNVEFVTYTLGENGIEIPYTAGDVLRHDGQYCFYARDYAGNLATYTVTRDTIVEYAFLTGDSGEAIDLGTITTSTGTTFTALNDDSVSIVCAFCDGEQIDPDRDGFNKNGKYEILLTDKVGNKTVFTFYVIAYETNTFTYPVPNGYKLSDIKYTHGNDSPVSYNTAVINRDGKEYVDFIEDGIYDIVFLRDDGFKRTVSITIDNSLPDAKLANVEDGDATVKDVTITNLMTGDTVKVYRDGVLTRSYTASFDEEELSVSEEGKYRIVVENRSGNRIEYSFTRLHVTNTAGSMLILIALAFFAIGVFIGLFYRNRSKFDK